jgi:tetratricopeptide (TPR) repeat protein
MEKDYFDIAQKVSITGLDSADPQIDKLHLVKDWLEKKIIGKWILVLDNADDIDLLYNTKRMADYFPRSSNGTILLTTRNKKVGTKFTATHGLLEVPAFTVVESVSLLKAKIGDKADESDYIRLANTLQNIPLALVQAAAFLLTEGISISGYLNLYRSNSSKIQLLSEDFEDDLRDKDSKNQIAATFATSFEQIEKSDPRAAEILSIMSMFDTQAIPASLLPLGNNNIYSTKALGTLKAFSLITKMSQQNQTDETFDLHRLVRLSMHNWLKGSHNFNIWCSKAISCISQRFPLYSTQNHNICRSYAPHALKVLSSHETLNNPISREDFQRASTTEKETAVHKMRLQNNLACYLRAYKQDHVLAVSIMQKSFTIAKMLPREDNKFGASTACQLVELLQKQNKYKEAEEVIRQTLELRETTLGEEDKYIWTLWSALAIGMMNQGKIEDEDAEHVIRRILSSRVAVLGEQHPDLRLYLPKLIYILTKRGKYEEAEKSVQRILTLSLGEDFSFISDAMRSMALILTKQRKYIEAERTAQETLALSEIKFGREHPNTLDSMETLYCILCEQQKWKERKELSQSMLKLSEKLWGKDHSRTREISQRVLKLREVMKT